ncbi:hypothetical protein FB451DRAFT_1406420 [Mycena latifolia]|nr:hypothetical protein FB451DRAFT_1406420 [Mycena latifolia]
MDAASPVPSGSRLFATGVAAAGPRASAECLASSLRAWDASQARTIYPQVPSADTTLGSSAAAASGSAETSAPGGVTSKPIDTRVYSTSRLPCDYGYEDAPVLVTGMWFELPLVLRYTGRDVEDGDLCTEMWSPNSVQHAFLPGLESKELKAPTPFSEFRRWDGHWGRFDTFVAPQYDSEGSSSWSPFIRRAHTWANDAKGRCLVTPVHAVWRTNAADRTARLAPDFITDLRRAYHSLDAKMLQLKEDTKVTDEDWDARPRIPENKPLLDELEAMCLYEDAVDAAALAQRVLRAMDAWTSMVSALQRVPMDLKLLRERPYPAADEQFVGVWINDAHEEYALWLLAVGVPVFIHHRYGPDEIRRSERFQTPRVRSYLEMTSTAPLLSASGNGFQFIAEREQFPITTTGLEERGMGLSSSYDTHFTSSLLLEARREAWAQGAELPNSPPRRVSLEEKYAPKPLELVVLDERRLPWIKPPTVLSGARSGKWEKWVQYESTSTPSFLYLRKHGHSWKPTSPHLLCYDRKERRELYLRTDHAWPMGVLDRGVFGIPAPRDRYYEVVQQGGKAEYKLRRPSHWVYDKRTSVPGDVGKKPLTPDARLLLPKSAPPRHPGLEKGWKDDNDNDDGMSDDDDEGPPALPAAGATLGQEENVAAPDATISSLPKRLTCSPVDEAMPDAPPAPTAAPSPPITEVVGSAVGPDRDDDEVSLGDNSELSDEGREPTPGRQYEHWSPYARPPMLPSSPRAVRRPSPPARYRSPSPPRRRSPSPRRRRPRSAPHRRSPSPNPHRVCSPPRYPRRSPSTTGDEGLDLRREGLPRVPRAIALVTIRRVLAPAGAAGLRHHPDAMRLAPGLPGPEPLIGADAEAAPRLPIAVETISEEDPGAAEQQDDDISRESGWTAHLVGGALRRVWRPTLASPSRASLSQRLALPGPPLMERMNSESSETSRLITRLALPLSSRVQSIEHSETGRVRVRWRERGRRAGKHNRKWDKKDVVNSDEEDEDLSDYDD